MRLWHSLKWRTLALLDGYPDFSAYRRLLRQERMTTDQLEDLRLKKVDRLVAACLHDIPYYRDIMNQAGIIPGTVRSMRDLEVLPLLNKEIIRAQGTRLLNPTLARDQYFSHTTGGSTGMPVDFYRGHEYDKLANAAANMRAFRRMGWRPGDSMLCFWSPQAEGALHPGLLGPLRRAARRWLTPPGETFSAYAASMTEMERWASRMKVLRPRFLYGYATVITLFANFLYRRGIRQDGVRGIATTGETLFPRDREVLREVYPHTRIIDIFGSREIPGIASECAFGSMHINADLVHVEYLPVSSEDSRHRLVITALDNTVFPFIRYDIGDYGSPSSEECPCGISFPTMRWGVGKILDSFISPEGRIMYGGFFEGLMYRIKGVHTYQFRQKTETDLILYFVPSESFDESTRDHFTWVEREIRKDFSPLASLRVEQVSSIPLTPAGKHRFVVSEVNNPVLLNSAPLA